MDAPAWFRQLKWSAPQHVSQLNQDRDQIPDFTGCYAFTEGPVPLAPGRVMYIGEAAGQSLRSRLSNYLVSFRSRPLPPGTKAHKGKGFILAKRRRVGDLKVYVRWVEYGGGLEDIHTLEASLIHYLNPAYNDRVEEYRHPLLADGERLDARLIR